MISENTKMEIARRIILTTFSASSTAVMRMVMMMLMMLTISYDSCNAAQSLAYIDSIVTFTT